MMTKTDAPEEGKVHFVASQCPHSGCWYWMRWSFFLPSLKIEYTLVIFVKLMLQHFVQFGQSVIEFFNIFRWFVWIVASIFISRGKHWIRNILNVALRDILQSWVQGKTEMTGEWGTWAEEVASLPSSRQIGRALALVFPFNLDQTWNQDQLHSWKPKPSKASARPLSWKAAAHHLDLGHLKAIPLSNPSQKPFMRVARLYDWFKWCPNITWPLQCKIVDYKLYC